jgi:hypothetical protein
MGNAMNRTVSVILYIILALFVLAIGSVAIREGSVLVANLGKYIMGLFARADLRPNRQGFDEFIQLIAIAIFVGWTIYRFKRRK